MPTRRYGRDFAGPRLDQPPGAQLRIAENGALPSAQRTDETARRACEAT